MKTKAIISLVVIAALVALSGCDKRSEIQKNAQEFQVEKSNGKAIFGGPDNQQSAPAEQTDLQKNAKNFHPEKSSGKVIFGDLSKDKKK